jgi:hypothetical protein
MPPLLQSAQLKPDVSVTSAGPEDGNDESDDEGYCFSFFLHVLYMCIFIFSFMDEYHMQFTLICMSQ